MLANAGTVFEKCLTSLFERLVIMAARGLNSGDFLALPDGGGGHLFKRRQIAAGENIFVDPPVAPAGSLADRNQMDKRQPVCCK